MTFCDPRRFESTFYNQVLSEASKTTGFRSQILRS